VLAGAMVRGCVRPMSLLPMMPMMLHACGPRSVRGLDCCSHEDWYGHPKKNLEKTFHVRSPELQHFSCQVIEAQLGVEVAQEFFGYDLRINLPFVTLRAIGPSVW
jgi:hypothetical protein